MTRAVCRAVDPRTGAPLADPEQAAAWSPSSPHGVGGQWWTVSADGIHVQGAANPLRTAGAPRTLLSIQRCYGPGILATAKALGVSARVLAAVVATESGGSETAERYEPRLGDYSTGLCQTLTTTAAGVYGRAARALGWPTDHPADQGAWRRLLCNPAYSLGLGAALLAALDHEGACQGDPVLLYAAYNAGSDRIHSVTTDNPWGLVEYGKALDHFASWYGDACAVFPAEGP